MNRVPYAPHRATSPSEAAHSPGPAARLLRVGGVLAGLCLVVGCAQQQPTAVTTTPPWHGVVGQTLVHLDPIHGASTELLTSPELSDLGALTYAADCACFYGVVRSTTQPLLVRIDPASGSVERITRLRLKGLRMNRVEALAWNPVDGRLYAAGGESTFASHRLFSIDPTSRSLEDYGDIEGTMQNEIDALAVASGKLLAIDSAAQASRLYSLELRPDRVRAHPLGESFPGTIVDMEYDPERYVMLAVDTEGHLLTVDLAGRLQSMSESPGLGAVALMRGKHLVPVGLFADGFESGTLALWSDHRGRHRENSP